MGIKLTTKGAYTLIKGYTDVFANLPLASHHDGELWIVLRGSQPKIPLTKWYEYPAGLYISAENEWQIAPMSIEFAEIASLQANITDWSTFHNSIDYINTGTSLIYGGKIYSNITGSATTTPPTSDTTNWASKVAFDINNTALLSEGVVGWDDNNGTLSIGMPGGSVFLQVGQEILIRATNKSGSIITNGTPVYISGVTGSIIEINKADAASQDNNRKIIAVTTEDILNNQKGYITTFGFVRGINTSGCLEGDEIFVSVGGGFTNIKPSLPNGIVRVGYCTRASATEGAIFVNIDSKSVKDILTDSGDLTIRTASGYTAILEQPVYEDLNFDLANVGGPAATLPDYVAIDNVYYREFTSLNNQTCGDGAEIPHNYKLSSTIYPHLHIFLKSGETPGTTGVTFRIYWSYRQTATATTSGFVDLSATSAQLSSEQYKLNLYDLTGFTGPSKLGSQLSLRLDRIAGNAGDVIVTTFGVHYAIDTIGSRQVFSK